MHPVCDYVGLCWCSSACLRSACVLWNRVCAAVDCVVLRLCCVVILCLGTILCDCGKVLSVRTVGVRPWFCVWVWWESVCVVFAWVVTGSDESCWCFWLLVRDWFFCVCICPPPLCCASAGFIVTCLDLGFVEEVEKNWIGLRKTRMNCSWTWGWDRGGTRLLCVSVWQIFGLIIGQK